MINPLLSSSVILKSLNKLPKDYPSEILYSLFVWLNKLLRSLLRSIPASRDKFVHCFAHPRSRTARYSRSLNKINLRLVNRFKTGILVSKILKTNYQTILIYTLLLLFLIRPDIKISPFFRDPGSFSIPTNHLRLFFSLTLFLLVTIAINSSISKKFRFVLRRIDLFIFIFLIVMSGSVFFSLNPDTSMRWVFRLLRNLLVYFIFSRIFITKKQLYYIIYFFIGSIFLELLISILQFFNSGVLGIPFETIDKMFDFDGEQISILVDGGSYFRSLGTFYHPNTLGAYVVTLLPILIIFAFNKNVFLRYIAFCAVISSWVILIISGSRWSLTVGVFIFLLTFKFVYQYLNLKFQLFSRNLLTYSLSLIFFLALSSSHPLIHTRILQASPEDSSLRTRLNLIDQAVHTIKNYPLLGVGVGNFTTYFSREDATELNLSDSFLVQVHSFYLLLASESGLLGLISFIMILVEIIRLFFSNINKISHEYKPIIISLFLTIISFSFYELWEPRAINDYFEMIFWILLGLYINSLIQADKNKSLSASSPRLKSLTSK